MNSILNSGEIQIIFGPMFSGKSTELIRRIRRQTVANRKCLVIKYKADTRYSEDALGTHDRQTWDAWPCSSLSEVEGHIAEFDVIGIDEGQFFPDVVSFSEAAANSGKTVIIAALDGTYQRKPFGNVLDLVPLAEEVIKLRAICHFCFREAAFSKRIGQETEIELIGGADKYVAVCRECFSMPH
eukprot:gnl/Spiro4/27264_TR13563_c0_g1_i1.p1 gnl/Spiro4/27264_TR13563_c0_g1~~gnl/Spiro4/27264_TR13563_c0_g1_i1.p1  ORF type:complete len:184 (+),score=39.21 gnl/Spiro4/27264_TR13563_c0_g1_i1:53-604(+)